MSNYMSNTACEQLLALLGPELYDRVVAIVDEEIEAYAEMMCDGCEERMPDEPRYNEGYL